MLGESLEENQLGNYRRQREDFKPARKLKHMCQPRMKDMCQLLFLDGAFLLGSGSSLPLLGPFGKQPPLFFWFVVHVRLELELSIVREDISQQALNIRVQL